jgi:hypothetical protein
MVIAAPNQVVRGADAALPASGTRRSTKYAVETIGAFLLVFTVGTAVGSGSPFAPLGIGAVLIVILYAGGHPSAGPPRYHATVVVSRKEYGITRWGTTKPVKVILDATLKRV